MPNRELREGILTSERVNSLDPLGELFYRRLMSVVDDFGRYYAHPTLLMAACYPLRLHEVTAADVSRWLAACKKAGLLMIYKARGSNYLELCNFKNRKRALHSKFPGMPGSTDAPPPSPGGASERHPWQKEFPAIADGRPASAGQMPGADATRSEKREAISEKREAAVRAAPETGPVIHADSGAAGIGRRTGGSEDESRDTANPSAARQRPRRRENRTPDEEFIAELKRNPAYAGINIDREIGKARAWLLTPKGARRPLSRQFLVNWLNRAESPLQLETNPAKPPRPEPEGWRAMTLHLYPGATLPETFWKLTGDIQREVREALNQA